MMKAPGPIKDVRGVIFIAGTMLLAGVALGLFALVRVAGQQQEQVHIQHVADHATEAVAVVAARDLNFKAMTNRAMLANEIVIAQLLGLYSWYRTLDTTSTNVALLTAWIPYINVMTRAIAQAIGTLRTPMETMTAGALGLQTSFFYGLSAAQVAHHGAALATSLATAEDILRQADSDLELLALNHATLIGYADVWLRMQRLANRPDDRQEYARMAWASRDPFTDRRTYVPFEIRGVVRLRKTGGSALRRREHSLQWGAVDSFGIHVPLASETPVGWGGASITRSIIPELSRWDVRDRHFYGGTIRYNSRSGRLAFQRSRFFGYQHRVPVYYRLAGEREDAQITLVVRQRPPEPEPDESTKPEEVAASSTRGAARQAALPTWQARSAEQEEESEATAPRGHYELPQPVLWAAARAKIRFDRPQSHFPRADGQYEKPNLFNSLWRAELTTIGWAERQLLGIQVRVQS